MTDKELLELAANAAGIEIKHWIGNTPHSPEWNPLTDDGDAFRLMVKLGIMVAPPAFNGGFEATASAKADGIYWIDIDETREFSNEATTRRAIVRAAAEIGKRMK